MIRIKKTKANFEKECLKSPFGFKGGYIKELWQSIAEIKSFNENIGLGLGVQSIHWSDAKVYLNKGETEGNNTMFQITQYALKTIEGLFFKNPIELMEEIFPKVYEYGKRITGNPDLRKTFILNALVPVDNALWLLYSKEKGINEFNRMIPEDLKNDMTYKHKKLLNIPLITYGQSLEDIDKLLREGYSLLKIKIGSDPEGDGEQSKMLEWDKQRLNEIHKIAQDYRTPYTTDGKVYYYLDANGRYKNKDILLDFLEYADKIDALKRIMLLEEPFPEEHNEDVFDIPVRIVADESAHQSEDVVRRIEMGYGAIALKPIAKTMSVSFRMLKIAFENKIPSFCADLTVNPILVDWNKNVASRLEFLPGMNVGILEANGQQNYANWDTLKKYHPFYGASWLDTKKGIYQLDELFYKHSGGIFKESNHYASLVRTHNN